MSGTCSLCGHVLTCPRCTGKAGGKIGGARGNHAGKGFAVSGPDAQAKAQATKRNKRLAKYLAASGAVK